MSPLNTKTPVASRNGTGGARSEELRKVRDRELELKRMSGELSCLDCRRLKLKCDRKIPCSSCVRRGAGSLCPLGARAYASRSARRIVTDGPVSESHRTKRKLDILCERISALEDALALESQARGGPGSHALLSEGLMAIKRCVHDDEEEEYADGQDSDELLTAFGTLTIDDHKTMRYLGPAASESVLVMEVLESGAASRASITAPSSSITSELAQRSKSFPFAHSLPLLDSDELLRQLVTYLPAYERATALYEAFFVNVAWLSVPVQRSHIISEIVPMFYRHCRLITPAQVGKEQAHDLALLFGVFACGAVADLTQSPINEEAEYFHNLSKVTLSVESIMHGTTLSGVQAVFLLSSYDFYSGNKPNLEDAWKLAKLGCGLAASIGLHRDPSRWGLEAALVERRRWIFWAIYSIDIWTSLRSGRPSTFRLHTIDCEFPTDVPVILGEDADSKESVQRWCDRFLRDIMSDICERLSSARPLRYRDVLELDRKIRGFPLHPLALRLQQKGLDISQNVFEQIYPLISAWNKEESLMYIHRNFFARAILDFPDNPMQSPFAASFLATYRGASTVLRMCRENMEHIYLHILRVWEVWSLCLTCGVIVGTVACLGASVNFAESAFSDLEYAISIFETYSDHKVAIHGLPLLRRMREKAVQALRRQADVQHATGDEDRQVAKVPTIRRETDDGNEELLILRGTTRVVEHRSTPASDSPGSDESIGKTEQQPRARTNGKSNGNIHPIAGAHLFGSAGVSQSTHSVFVTEMPEKTLSINNIQESAIPPQQEDSYPWLAELDQMLGSSGVPQQSHVDPGRQYPDASSQWPNPFPVLLNLDASSLPEVPAPSFQQPTTSSLDGTSIMPSMLLDRTVSTEAWSVLMQQSGLSDSSAFDYNLDGTVPTAAYEQNADVAVFM